MWILLGEEDLISLKLEDIKQVKKEDEKTCHVLTRDDRWIDVDQSIEVVTKKLNELTD